jgi:hypothetical protein
MLCKFLYGVPLNLRLPLCHAFDVLITTETMITINKENIVLFCLKFYLASPGCAVPCHAAV